MPERKFKCLLRFETRRAPTIYRLSFHFSCISQQGISLAVIIPEEQKLLPSPNNACHVKLRQR